MDELKALTALAEAMGVYTHYVDGLGRPVTVEPETLVRVCASLGAPLTGPRDAASALIAWRERDRGFLPPVVVAWDGKLPSIALPAGDAAQVELTLEQGDTAPITVEGGEIRSPAALPPGYHELRVDAGGRTARCTVISAPELAWRRPGSPHSWGVGAQLAALRSRRSRSLGDLRDLETTCRWIHERGGDLAMVLPLLPTFNAPPAEPSPYSPVSRLFWSELILDLGDAHEPTSPPAGLDVIRADAEVRKALAGLPVPDPSGLDDELVRYARFRGVQARYGRNWRDWPAAARDGTLTAVDVDAEEERFHLVAQVLARRQLGELRQRLEHEGFRLGLDLAVGVHPDGYDTWSRQALFAGGMSVGAPPDAGFPSGQDWGFPPVLPGASRMEGHRYIAASIAHQASLAGVLRIDHVMAWTRLYWIPHGLGKHEGTYVTYPDDELFAVLTLESVRHRSEVAGENLGTVPPHIDEALPRHRIWGMYLAQFEAWFSTAPAPEPASGDGGGPAGETGEAYEGGPPSDDDIALIGTHDTPTFAGWLEGRDIDERIRCGLLAEAAVPAERARRAASIRWLADELGCSPEDPSGFLNELLDWLGRSDSPLVIPWLEDFWLEPEGVNLPGTSSAQRPNWQRPMSRLLEDAFDDPEVDRRVRLLDRARGAG